MERAGNGSRTAGGFEWAGAGALRDRRKGREGVFGFQQPGAVQFLVSDSEVAHGIDPGFGKWSVNADGKCVLASSGVRAGNAILAANVEMGASVALMGFKRAATDGRPSK